MSLIASCLYRLGESIVANNAYRQQEMQHRAKRIQMQAPVTSTTSVRCSSSYPSSNDSKASNIEELIQKLHSGLEVSRIYIPFWNIWHFFYCKEQKWKSKCQTTTVCGTVKFGLDSCLFGMGSFYWAPEQNSGMLYWATPEGRTPYCRALYRGSAHSHLSCQMQRQEPGTVQVLRLAGTHTRNLLPLLPKK